MSFGTQKMLWKLSCGIEVSCHMETHRVINESMSINITINLYLVWGDE